MSKVREFVVGCFDTAPKDNGLDLDGLRLMTRPEGINSWPAEKRTAWLRENGYDLSVDFDGKKMWVHGVNTNIVVVAGTLWDEADLSWIIRTLQPGAASSALVLWELPSTVALPLTFAFRTVNGASGLFRVTAFSQADKQATIQVRLP